MKIYVTKYLFTEGIQEMEAEEQNPAYPSMATTLPSPDRPAYSQNFHGNDWHRTREAAVVHAEKMRTKKLASIDKQRKKIADMVIA